MTDLEEEHGAASSETRFLSFAREGEKDLLWNASKISS
jgi:hypothetical protein